MREQVRNYREAEILNGVENLMQGIEKATERGVEDLMKGIEKATESEVD